MSGQQRGLLPRQHLPRPQADVVLGAKGSPPEGTHALPLPAVVELNLAEHGLCWDNIWDEKAQAFTPSSAENLQTLLFRATLAQQIPAHFALRFGKESVGRILQRPGEAHNTICGMPRHLIGCKLSKHATTSKLKLPKKKYHFMNCFEWAVVGCCGMQFDAPPQAAHPAPGVPHDLESVTEPDTEEDLQDSHRLGPSHHSSRACDDAVQLPSLSPSPDRAPGPCPQVADAAVQTDCDVDQLAAWVKGLQEQSRQHQRGQLQPQHQHNQPAAAASFKQTLDLPQHLQHLQKPVSSMCGAPIIMGRIKRSNTLRVMFPGPCCHGPDAHCVNMLPRLKQELIRLAAERAGEELPASKVARELEAMIYQANPSLAYANNGRLGMSAFSMARNYRPNKRKRAEAEPTLLQAGPMSQPEIPATIATTAGTPRELTLGLVPPPLVLRL